MTSYNTYRNLDNLDCIYAPLYAVNQHLSKKIGQPLRKEIFQTVIKSLGQDEVFKIITRGCSVKIFGSKIMPIIQSKTKIHFQTIKRNIEDKYIDIHALHAEIRGVCSQGYSVIFCYKCDGNKLWACTNNVTEDTIVFIGSHGKHLAIKDCSFENDAKYQLIKNSFFILSR